MKFLSGSLCSLLFRFFSMVTHGVICERICSRSCTGCHVLLCLKAAFLLRLRSLEDMIMICSLVPSVSPHNWLGGMEDVIMICSLDLSLSPHT
jgi:hypothetical protein